MQSVVIYREDLKISLLKNGDQFTLPKTEIEEISGLRGWDVDTVGFYIKQTGTKEGDFLVCMRNSGSQKANTSWHTIEETAQLTGNSTQHLKTLVEKDIAKWNEIHLDTIKKVFKLFQSEHVEILLSGGWAVDFLAGRISRPHVDVDTIVREQDSEIIKLLLERNGYSVKDKTNSSGVRKFQNTNGQDIGFDCYFTDSNVDNLFTGSVEVTLNDIKVKIVNPTLFEQELAEKTKRNHQNSEELSGFVGKTDHDLQLVREYLKLG